MADPSGGVESDVRPSGDESVRANPDFDDVFAAEQAPLIALAFSLTGNLAVAEDLTQEAFLRLHQRWAQVAGYEQPGAWVRRVLINLARSRARRFAVEMKALARLRRQRRPEPVLSPETAEFWAVLRDLPQRQSEVLALYYVDDRPVAEVAEILGLAEGTVRAHLHRGRDNLRARVRPDQESSS